MRCFWILHDVASSTLATRESVNFKTSASVVLVLGNDGHEEGTAGQCEFDRESVTVSSPRSVERSAGDELIDHEIIQRQVRAQSRGDPREWRLGSEAQSRRLSRTRRRTTSEDHRSDRRAMGDGRMPSSWTTEVVDRAAA